MGKALLGTHVTPSSLRLLDEVRALRSRVAQLEAALAAAEAARDEPSSAETTLHLEDADERTPVAT